MYDCTLISIIYQDYPKYMYKTAQTIDEEIVTVLFLIAQSLFEHHSFENMCIKTINTKP